MGFINYCKWFEQSQAKGFDALEFIVNEQNSLQITSEDGKVNQQVKSDLSTIIINGLYKNKKASIYLEKNHNDLMIDTILDVLKKRIEILSFKEIDIIFSGSKLYPIISENNFDFSQIDINLKINLLLKLQQELLASCYFSRKSDISYTEIFSRQILVNSQGLNLQKKNSYAIIDAMCIFAREQEKEEIYKRFPVKIFQDFNFSDYAQKIITLGEKKINGRSLKSSIYPTVLANEVFADLLCSFQNVFSGLYAYRNLTKLKKQQKMKIASSKVTIIDDPLSEKAFFQHPFDDEGVACQAKNIITNGLFDNFIHNLKTAHIFHQEALGNCFNGTIAMSNCYLQKGHKSFQDMISVIQEGVYINSIIGLHAGVNDISGDFSLQAAGFKINKGEITTAVKMIVLSGNFFDILQNIQDISDDFVFSISGFGSSSVYVGNLTIAGDMPN
ncbi:MAG: metallopeptidase TldD-related protein [Weeping tea tree witches'-broom phytoplasma]|uniref:metallopeptidase TldD-related protein n=1 Tax=Candidatus Phytoplasma melaleucae TaxID=2982630 RepID=UPI00293B6A03|nr:metallopeptidase TldD-related protein [Weeping tea tree witches'-broom phytoplasma]